MDIGGFDAARHRNSVELDSQLELRILLCLWLIIFSFSFNYKMRPLKRQHTIFRFVFWQQNILLVFLQ